MSRTQFGALAAEPGQRTHGWVRVPGVEPPWEMPAFVIRGRQPGPTLAVTGGDLIEGLVPFAIYQQTGRADLDSQALALADAYGLDYVLGAPAEVLRGTSYNAAARLGVPAIIAEVGQQGIYDQDSVKRHLTGLRNVLMHLGMLEGRPATGARSKRLSGFEWMYADVTATYHPVVAAGDVVATGQTIGELRDIFGDPVQGLRAPAGGPVLFLVTALAVKKGDPLIGIGVP